MNMLPFRLHLLWCRVCRRMPKMPCVEGWRLLNDHAQVAARTIDPKRGKA
jgi:hypothetical protein